MGQTSLDRRALLKSASLVGAAAFLASPVFAQAQPKVVVIGGGFAGATCARELKRAGLSVTLVEPNATYTACPFSNSVLAGMRQLPAQQFGYDALKKDGVSIAQQNALRVDADKKEVTLADGGTLTYDRLVLAPGIDLRFDALPGYSEEAAKTMPHAWKA